MMNKIKGYLNSEYEGSTMFEWVLISAFVVTVIVAIFQLIQPAFTAKLNTILAELTNA